MEQKGAFVNMRTLENGDLEIELTPTGKDEIIDMQKSKKSDEACFLEMIEDFLCNGWSNVAPEDVGALTSSLILSDDAVYNDEGELTSINNVWWFPNYQIKGYLDDLAEHGKVVWTSGKE